MPEANRGNPVNEEISSFRAMKWPNNVRERLGRGNWVYHILRRGELDLDYNQVNPIPTFYREFTHPDKNPTYELKFLSIDGIWNTTVNGDSLPDAEAHMRTRLAGGISSKIGFTSTLPPAGSTSTPTDGLIKELRGYFRGKPKVAGN